MLQRLRSRFNREEGFTLIELLVVILIIGILAAIAIPSFLNQRGKGEDAEAKSGAKTAQTAMETYYTERGNYNCGIPAACDTALRLIEEQLPVAADLAITEGATGYTVAVTSQPSGRVFRIVKAAGGAVTMECTVPDGADAGGCTDGDDGTGTW